jgi:hypothetical protein
MDIRKTKLVSNGKQGTKKFQFCRLDGQTLTAPGRRDSQNFYTAHEDLKVVTPTDRLPLLPMRYPWYSFLLEAESTPGPQCGRRILTHRDLNPRPFGL